MLYTELPKRYSSMAWSRTKSCASCKQETPCATTPPWNECSLVDGLNLALRRTSSQERQATQAPLDPLTRERTNTDRHELASVGSFRLGDGRQRDAGRFEASFDLSQLSLVWDRENDGARLRGDAFASRCCERAGGFPRRVD